MQQRKPKWLRIKIQGGPEKASVEALLDKLSLHSVCEEANCPNRMECFSKSTATFMILGRICSRRCTFCNVEKGSPELVDLNEPSNLANAVAKLKLKHVVITSVTRDDLPDGGAAHFAAVLEEIRKRNEKITTEVLIPDFKGNKKALDCLIQAKPEVINHNVETVPRLYPSVRPKAVYTRSLELLQHVKTADETIFTKSGIMLGLGEKEEEVFHVLKDLRSSACDFLTIGQYLAPCRLHHPVIEYIHPEVFEKYRKAALQFGFKHVSSAPLVRSSYNAQEALEV